LKWEERHGKNIGLDVSFFDDRLSGTIDIFRDKTVNLLFDYTVPTPPFFINTILANVGTLSNNGEEFSVSADIIKGKKFTGPQMRNSLLSEQKLIIFQAPIVVIMFQPII
jgi:iron complex outermembrane receptor protein